MKIIKPQMFIPSEDYLKLKLNTRKAKKRSKRRIFSVLTSKLTREHIRKLYKNSFKSVDEI